MFILMVQSLRLISMQRRANQNFLRMLRISRCSQNTSNAEIHAISAITHRMRTFVSPTFWLESLSVLSKDKSMANNTIPTPATLRQPMFTTKQIGNRLVNLFSREDKNPQMIYRSPVRIGTLSRTARERGDVTARVTPSPKLVIPATNCATPKAIGCLRSRSWSGSSFPGICSLAQYCLINGWPVPVSSSSCSVMSLMEKMAQAIVVQSSVYSTVILFHRSAEGCGLLYSLFRIILLQNLLANPRLERARIRMPPIFTLTILILKAST